MSSTSISLLSFLLFASLCSNCVVAQQQLVIPQAYEFKDAPSMRWVAGVAVHMREQWVVSHAALTPMLGKTITGIVLRRDTGIPKARMSGAGDFVVRMSSGGAAPLSPAARMASNHGRNLQTVFSGRVPIPASSTTTLGSVSWAATDVVRVSFTTGFPYLGGDLCVDLDGVPVGSSLDTWTVDSFASNVEGTVASVGSSSSAYLASVNRMGERKSSHVSAGQLVVGNSVVFQASGTPLGGCSLMIGVGLLPRPVNLAFLGAPRANLYVDPIIVVGSGFSAPMVPGFTRLGGDAVVSVQLPVDPRVMGSAIVVQWIDFGSPLATSNALVCGVAATQPVVEMSLVTAQYDGAGTSPSEGHVEIGAGHVIKFEYQ